MIIGILGATGNTGTYVLEEALKRKLKINIFVRSPQKLSKSIKKKCHIVSGDATDKKQAQTFVKNCDSVISVIGHTKNSPKNIQTTAILNIISAMKKNKVRRLISLTGSAVPSPKDKFSPIHTITNFLVNAIDPHRVTDGKEHVNKIVSSPLNWSIVRTPLQISVTSHYQASLGPLSIASGPWVARNNLAKCIVDCAVSQNHYSKQMPVISQWKL